MSLVSTTTLLNRIAAAGLLVIGCAAHAQGVAQAATVNPAAPPPGTVTGAYGQSLQQQQAAADKAAPAATAVKTSAAQPATAGDAVSRFLAERGLTTAAEQPSGSSRLLASVRDTASDLVLSAMNFLGVRYTRGGNSVENGFDCSGFTRHIFEMSVGLVLPRRADEQAKSNSLAAVRKEELKPGDLVFFNTMRATFSHVGIYVGEGKFIHAPRTGSAVRVEDMRDAYWAKRFTGARRADLKAAAEAPSTR
ncbi:C40 family peptidase [Roseateles sp. BYS78W]|uniref:C40 family peptidase n=1 Tax=Pelomonas candidula TaxID=3299025 RepID=A0ABW7HK56_9BURK